MTLESRRKALSKFVGEMTEGPWVVVENGRERFFAKDRGMRPSALPQHTPEWNREEENMVGLVKLRNDALPLIDAYAQEVARLREALGDVLPYAVQQDCGGPDIAAALSKARAALAEGG